MLGHFEKEIDPSEIGSATPETGKMYRVYNAKTKTLSDAWYVLKVEDKELGLKNVHLARHYTDDTQPTIVIGSSNQPIHNQVPSVIALLSSAKYRHCPPQFSGRSVCSNSPVQPIFPGSNLWPSAPAADCHRIASIEPTFWYQKARPIRAYFQLDDYGTTGRKINS